jgi:hypothetical protein
MSNQILFYDNHVIAEWRRWFDWKTRAQNSEQLRSERERNQYEDYCTFHVFESYPNQPRHGKLIIIDFPTACGSPTQPPPHDDGGERNRREPVEELPDDNEAMETNENGRFEKNRQR